MIRFIFVTSWDVKRREWALLRASDSDHGEPPEHLVVLSLTFTRVATYHRR